MPPLEDNYTAGPGPFFEAEVDDPGNELALMAPGNLVAFDGVKAIAPAGDETRVAVSRGYRYDVALDKYFVELDGSGAIVRVNFPSAQAGSVAVVDSDTVGNTADPTKHCGLVVGIPAADAAFVELQDIAEAPYAS